jgi:signal transduction histidine kinase/ActR/RegA family two-component response regulator
MSDTTILKAIGILDGAAEDEFDELTELAKKTSQAPVVLISIIDLAGDRQFFKSATGLGEPWASMRQTPLSHSICQYVKADNAPVILGDTETSERLIGNRALDELGVRAYLGVPIEDAHHNTIGALCVIDNVPRTWSDENLHDLTVVAEAISSQIKLKTALLEARKAQKAAESTAAQLLENETRFQDLATNIPGAIFRYISHPDGSDEVEYISDGCVDIWEISSAEIKGSPAKLWQMIHPEDLPGLQAATMTSGSTLNQWEHRWRITTPSGKEKWLHGSGTPRRTPHGTVLWNSLILDVTAEVETQQRLDENADRLHDAQKQKSIGRLAGGIAHDFNNLMAIILGNVEFLLDGDLDRQEEQALQNEIRKAAIRGGELTKRLLSFAKCSELAPEVLDINQTILGMDDLLRRTIPENVAIEMTLASDLWQTKADKSFFEGALLNLVLNARDAMPLGGKLAITTSNLHITGCDSPHSSQHLAIGRYVMLEIADTGEGIAKDLQPNVFDPFVTTKGPDRGTGLGLSMVQGFAQQSGGGVRLRSEKGSGTSIKVYLSAHASAKRPANVPGPPSGTARPEISGRILLVEDEDSLRFIARKFLEKAGFNVMDAATGDQAYKLFASNPAGYDLLITDIIMPGELQGPLLVKEIRKIREDIPVIYISGYPDDEEFRIDSDRTKDMSLTKPLERKDFIAAVRQKIRSLQSQLHAT